MRRKFWKEVATGSWITILLLVILATAWFVNRHEFLTQTREQAVYLTQLSGLSGKEKIPSGDESKIKKMVDLTKIYAGEEDPEKALAETILLLGGNDVEDFGSYILQLTKHYPGAINLALKGDTSSARELQAKWYKDRHVRFYPFGLTLMLIFLVGILITIVAAIKSTTETKTRSSGPKDGDDDGEGWLAP